MAYQVLGNGPLDIVYVPGLLNLIEAGAEEPALARHLDRLTAFSRVVLFDKRGTGLSDRVPADEMADAQRRLDDLIGVMDALGLASAVLLATADGTAIATRFAARHRAACMPRALRRERRMLAARAMTPACHPRHAAGRASGGSMGQRRAPDGRRGARAEHAARQALGAALARMERRAATPRAAHAYWQKAGVEADVRDLLADVKAPTLVIHAAGDLLVPVAQGRFVAQAISGARHIELAGGEHFFWFQDGDVVTQHVEEFVTGGRSRHVGGRRLATVVFGDIVGSTGTAARLGDARWRDLLESHDLLVRRGLRRFGGEEIKFTGDGFLALFDATDSAVDFSSAMISEVTALGVELRVGLHTGTLELRGGDVAGMAVNVAARLLGHATGSDIVLTRTVRDLLGGAHLMTPLGRKRLKGISDEWELYRIAVRP